MFKENRSQTAEERALMKRLSDLPELMPAPRDSERIRQACLQELRFRRVCALKPKRAWQIPAWLRFPDSAPAIGVVIGIVYLFWMIDKVLWIYGF